MSLKYYLPCKCGERLIVEPRQAGEIVVCRCGQSLEVPTLRQLRNLDPLIEEVAATPSTWGLGQSLILLGVVILLGGVGLAYLFVREPPQNPFGGKSPEVIHEIAQNLPPAESWRMWILLRKMGPNPQKQWAERHYLEKLAEYRALWVLLIPVFIAGAAFIVAGIVTARQRRKRRAVAARAPT
ncbi:MAG: hypothetical protein JXB10_04570 [Pirellulales bacterium]|nr:hypothetical protein [Pirellulales bacterium]